MVATETCECPKKRLNTRQVVHVCSYELADDKTLITFTVLSLFKLQITLHTISD